MMKLKEHIEGGISQIVKTLHFCCLKASKMTDE